MNDPNGLIFYQDEWHLFYQHVPEGEQLQYWGHAVSRDLKEWQHLPLALEPDSLGAIWSGSAVWDSANSSGFFGESGGLVALFTHRVETSQSQSLAYSQDSGRTWIKYAGNPVLKSSNPNFRDPKVFWHEQTSSWVMIVAVGEQVEIYRSPNLKEWTFASAFGQNRMGDLCWECPDLFDLKDEGGEVVWILLSSWLSGDNFTGGFGQCYAGYFIGEFDGYTFNSPETTPVHRLSYGPDDYAGVTFANGPKGRKILIGWLNHWGYAGALPTSPWRGQMTLPRELQWRSGRLVQSLPLEFENLATTSQSVTPSPEAETEIPDSCWSAPVTPAMVDCWVDVAKAGQPIFSFGLEQGVWRLQRHPAALQLTPEKPGAAEFFAATYEAPASPEFVPTQEIRIFVDTCSVEIFCEDGAVLFCAQLFPPKGNWSVQAQGVEELQITSWS